MNCRGGAAADLVVVRDDWTHAALETADVSSVKRACIRAVCKSVYEVRGRCRVWYLQGEGAEGGRGTLQ